MKNTVTATIEFDFKGCKFTPSIRINLSEHLQSNNYFPDLCALIATENNIDHYSYEYEMMQANTIKFSDATGLVENYIVDGILRRDDFIVAWQHSYVLEKLNSIVASRMNIKDLSAQPDLENALLDAYDLGQKTNATNKD